MIKLFKALLCVAMLTGCSSTPCNNRNEGSQQQEPKKTDLEIVSEIFTFETREMSGEIDGILKENDSIKFKIYVSFAEKDMDFISMLGLETGMLVFCVDGEIEQYVVDTNKVLITKSNATAESMKEEMDNYLKEKGLTIEQVRNAMNEKFELK